MAFIFRVAGYNGAASDLIWYEEYNLLEKV